MFQVYARLPQQATEIEREAMVRLVVAGGAVTEAAVRAGIPRAKTLIFCAKAGQVIGVAALKQPQPAYRAGLASAAKSGVPLPEAAYPLELGYVAVEEAWRSGGLGPTLCTTAVTMAGARGLFATTGADSMRDRILPRLAFRATGAGWQGASEPLWLMLRG